MGPPPVFNVRAPCLGLSLETFDEIGIPFPQVGLFAHILFEVGEVHLIFRRRLFNELAI